MGGVYRRWEGNRLVKKFGSERKEQDVGVERHERYRWSHGRGRRQGRMCRSDSSTSGHVAAGASMSGHVRAGASTNMSGHVAVAATNRGDHGASLLLVFTRVLENQ